MALRGYHSLPSHNEKPTPREAWLLALGMAGARTALAAAPLASLAGAPTGGDMGPASPTKAWCLTPMASKAQKPQDRLRLWAALEHSAPFRICSKRPSSGPQPSQRCLPLALLSGQVPERGLALCTRKAAFDQPEDGAPAYLTKGATGGSDGLRVCVRKGRLEETRG